MTRHGPPAVRADLVLAIHHLNDVDKVERAVLLALAIFCNEKTGQCNPSHESLVERTGWSRTSVVDAIARLKKRKPPLLKSRRRRYVVYYKITIPGGSTGSSLGGQKSHPRKPAGGTLDVEKASGRPAECQPAACRRPAGGTEVKKEMKKEVQEAAASPRRPAAAKSRKSGSQKIGGAEYVPGNDLVAELKAERPEVVDQFPRMLERFQADVADELKTRKWFDRKLRAWWANERPDRHGARPPIGASDGDLAERIARLLRPSSPEWLDAQLRDDPAMGALFAGGVDQVADLLDRGPAAAAAEYRRLRTQQAADQPTSKPAETRR